MSSLVSWLAILMVMALEMLVAGCPGDGKGSSRLVWWDLVGGRGAAAPSHQQEIGGRRPPPLFH